MTKAKQMSQKKLTQKIIDQIKPQRKEYIIRDAAIAGFAIRVLPSGKKTFIFHHTQNGRRRYKTLGDANTMRLDTAQQQAEAIRNPTPIDDRRGDIRFEDVVSRYFESQYAQLKPSTFTNYQTIYERLILPYFRGRAIGEIRRQHVLDWFASCRKTPGSANYAKAVLSCIMRSAEQYNERAPNTNPCAKISRYKLKEHNRFLSTNEFQRLGKVLACYKSNSRDSDVIVQIIKLLIYTGCRRNEIATSKWSFYRDGRLYLPDSKTGARVVYLCSAARGIIEARPRNGAYIFSGRKRKLIDGNCLTRHWEIIRHRAGLDDVRLHDLRHTYASIALKCGASLPTIGCLLGHKDPETTLKYTHFGNDDTHRIAQNLANNLAKGL